MGCLPVIKKKHNQKSDMNTQTNKLMLKKERETAKALIIHQIEKQIQVVAEKS